MRIKILQYCETYVNKCVELRFFRDFAVIAAGFN